MNPLVRGLFAYTNIQIPQYTLQFQRIIHRNRVFVLLVYCAMQTNQAHKNIQIKPREKDLDIRWDLLCNN